MQTILDASVCILTFFDAPGLKQQASRAGNHQFPAAPVEEEARESMGEVTQHLVSSVPYCFVDFVAEVSVLHQHRRG